MKLRPLQDRILVQRVAEETTTKGGIIIPDTAKEKPAEGIPWFYIAILVIIIIILIIAVLFKTGYLYIEKEKPENKKQKKK